MIVTFSLGVIEGGGVAEGTGGESSVGGDAALRSASSSSSSVQVGRRHQPAAPTRVEKLTA